MDRAVATAPLPAYQDGNDNSVSLTPRPNMDVGQEIRPGAGAKINGGDPI